MPWKWPRGFDWIRPALTKLRPGSEAGCRIKNEDKGKMLWKYSRNFLKDNVIGASYFLNKLQQWRHLKSRNWNSLCYNYNHQKAKFTAQSKIKYMDTQASDPFMSSCRTSLQPLYSVLCDLTVLLCHWCQLLENHSPAPSLLPRLSSLIALDGNHCSWSNRCLFSQSTSWEMDRH